MILEVLITSYSLLFLFTMGLGFLQTPGLPTEAQATHSGDPAMYSMLAVSAVGLQALVTIICLWGSGWFPLGALFVAFTLLCHHAIIHRHSRFEGETCSCAPFQCKDVSNHETWVVAALVAALVSQLGL